MYYFEDGDGRIQAETMEIAVSLICQISCHNPNSIRVKNQVDRLIHRHEILFTGMLRKLDSLSVSIHTDERNRQDMLDDLLCLDLTRIFNCLIHGDQITWGKIITIFAFSTFIAKTHGDIADRIAHITGQYLVKRLTTWIKEHGGWVSRQVMPFFFQSHTRSFQDSMALMDATSDLENLNKALAVSLTCLGLSLLGLFLVLR